MEKMLGFSTSRVVFGSDLDLGRTGIFTLSCLLLPRVPRGFPTAISPEIINIS